MNITDFGPVKPTIQPYQGGYSVPVALQKVERPGMEDGTVEHSWQGYLLKVASLTELEFDNAAKALPEGNYSDDRLSVLQEAVRIQRRAAYPPIEDYNDAVVKGDDAALQAYKDACLAVKAKYPMPKGDYA